MALWSSWLPDILPHVPGCPIPVVQHELLRASQEFFTRTRAWLVTDAPVTVVADTEEIDLAPVDTEQDLVRVESVWFNGIPGTVKTVAEMDEDVTDWQTATGTPSIIVQLSPDVARFYPIPNADVAVKIRKSIRPSDSATGIPDDLAAAYRIDLAQGSKSRLMLYKDKPWTDPALAAVSQVQFNDAVSTANLDAARSFGKGRITARKKWC
jgi:hypothetical protein